MPEFLELLQVASTNTYVKQHATELPDGALVHTPSQSAGRGQKGNSWESEPGKNLTFSLLIKRPQVDVKRQFVLSEAVSLAIVETLAPLASLTIKWPNDIYAGDRKLAGILIEHDLDAEGIVNTVIGVGLNVNQTEFRSDAPNPVSLAQLTGREHDLMPMLERVGSAIEDYCRREVLEPDVLHRRYLSHLYRHDGHPHRFILPGDDAPPFEATIVDIDRDGMLTLRHADTTLHRYAFKEVAFQI
ncbi:MAG: biotin--[acetyl-CoA-carboxylase] ligase [Muribaculaceae bacterium]|nr:biotin--[acetyl-CoA-carboxylase] ligase [Muribaculaceae bacterium]